METIIAVGIFTVGVVSVISLINSVISSLGVSQERVIAANLAQEGIEIVRAVRDTNWIVDLSYNDGLADTTYCVEYSDLKAGMQVGPGGACLLYQDGNGIFSHASDGGPATPFSRLITITSDVDSSANPFLRIESEVTWNSNTFTVEDHLYDWK
ncbi:MAG: hypothetical protein WD850_01580 [Candidatus Spechtbacterales bacterium]